MEVVMSRVCPYHNVTQDMLIDAAANINLAARRNEPYSLLVPADWGGYDIKDVKRAWVEDDVLKVEVEE